MTSTVLIADTVTLPVAASPNAPPLAANRAPAELPFALPLGRDAQGLTRVQKNAVTVAIVAVHLAGVYALMQVREVRDTVREAAPMFVDWIAPPTPEPTPEPKPEPPKPQPAPRPIPKRAPVTNIVTAAPSPAPSTFSTAPVEEPVAVVAPVLVAAPAPATPAPPAPAPAPPPKIIPASAVQYLEAPVVDYPRVSRRNGETGMVVVRVFIDTAGMPRLVQVNTSSGHLRLDDAAIAAVNKARFKPYTENGRPMEGWALIPLNFELEK